ncbi:hypothetical protein GCM10020229_61790 [Kitasatospora albolonga]
MHVTAYGRGNQLRPYAVSVELPSELPRGDPADGPGVPVRSTGRGPGGRGLVKILEEPGELAWRCIAPAGRTCGGT